MNGLWGNIPQWVSSVGSSVSIFLALYIILRDRRAADREQASAIAAWIEKLVVYHINDQEHEVAVERVTVFVHNGSDLPITNVGMVFRAMTKREVKATADPILQSRYRPESKWGPFGTSAISKSDGMYASSLAPDGSLTWSEAPESDESHRSVRVPLDAYRRWFRFVDAAGRVWFRDVDSGELLAGKRRKTRRILRGSVLPIPNLFFERGMRQSYHDRPLRAMNVLFIRTVSLPYWMGSEVKRVSLRMTRRGARST
ncbi:hypothetical protein [Asanoa ishikariensis]|uniref:hypothetical protein n=1 Tax=Asanoa ishikariensis TaxID=137265 RepID=UPI00115FF612|nr:hypothetical protein [Asanoa ishikariensis]